MRISPPGDTPTDRESAKIVDGWELVLTLTGDGDIRGGIGGGGYISFTLPENHGTVHQNDNHHGYVYGSRAAPWGMGVPKVVGKWQPGPGGDVGSRKGGRNYGDGG